MPLIPSRSKKAVSKNIETEMAHGKPQKQSIAIALSVKPKKKKMAEGGTVKHDSPPSAKTEARPMPKRMDDSGKPASHDSWTDRSTVSQAQASPKPKLQPINDTRMTDSSVIHAHRIDALGQRLDRMEKHLQSSAAPALPTEHPESDMNEMEADKSGPSVPALKMKKMATGGKINDMMSMSSAEDDMVEHPAGLEEDDDQMRRPQQDTMSGDMPNQLAEGGKPESAEDYARRTGKPISSTFASEAPNTMKMTGDDEDESGAHMAAEGGMIDLDEMDEERHSSIAAAIMAKKKLKPGSDSGSPDEEHAERSMMAEGGEVDIDENAEEQPNEYYARNQAALKENYDSDMDDVTEPMDSNEMSDPREDESENKHDIVSSIRRKMKSRRQF